ncbi:NfeD family protein [Candidatus Sumerlaeota bacterium]|nr:NfeD family protein [Candidatus Sumerlaeota bacterium]
MNATIGGIDLTIAYWVIFGIGLVAMSIAFVAHDFFHFGDDGSVLPIAAFFMGVFGAAGIVSLHLLKLSPGMSVITSTVSAIAGSVGLYFGVLRIIRKNSGTLSDKREDIVGATAEVSLAISEDQLGQITFTTPSGRSSAPARSADGKPIKQGTPVTITRSIGTTYVVTPVNFTSKEEEKT